MYLGVLVVGGSYLLTRLGLADLEAGYAVNQLSGHVGDTIPLYEKFKPRVIAPVVVVRRAEDDFLLLTEPDVAGGAEARWHLLPASR